MLKEVNGSSSESRATCAKRGAAEVLMKHFKLLGFSVKPKHFEDAFVVLRE